MKDFGEFFLAPVNTHSFPSTRLGREKGGGKVFLSLPFCIHNNFERENQMMAICPSTLTRNKAKAAAICYPLNCVLCFVNFRTSRAADFDLFPKWGQGEGNFFLKWELFSVGDFSLRFSERLVHFAYVILKTAYNHLSMLYEKLTI